MKNDSDTLRPRLAWLAVAEVSWTAVRGSVFLVAAGMAAASDAGRTIVLVVEARGLGRRRVLVGASSISSTSAAVVVSAGAERCWLVPAAGASSSVAALKLGVLRRQSPPAAGSTAALLAKLVAAADGDDSAEKASSSGRLTVTPESAPKEKFARGLAQPDVVGRIRGRAERLGEGGAAPAGTALRPEKSGW